MGLLDTGWFHVRRVERDTYLIAEPMHVNSFLLVGSRRALLADTGLGIGDIRAAVESVTRLPVVVVNTHHHFDHVGGNHLFAERLIHEAGVTAVVEPTPGERLRGYVQYIEDLLAHYPAFQELDRRYFGTVDMPPRPLPADFRPERWTIAPPQPTGTVRDGELIELGGRQIRVLHTPGHTPDSVCLLDEDAGILIGGDMINTGAIYIHLPDSDLGAFVTSTRRLVRDRADSLHLILMMHGVRYAAEGGFLTEIADAAEQVAGGAASYRVRPDLMGAAAREADFGRFSLLLPA
ncbi:MAG: MBL fold metallo-hydrolase [Clostridia bacterium]